MYKASLKISGAFRVYKGRWTRVNDMTAASRVPMKKKLAGDKGRSF